MKVDYLSGNLMKIFWLVLTIAVVSGRRGTPRVQSCTHVFKTNRYLTIEKLNNQTSYWIKTTYLRLERDATILKKLTDDILQTYVSVSLNKVYVN